LQELVYEGRREPFANLKDLRNVILEKWFDVDIRQPKSKKPYSSKKATSNSGKEERRTYISTFSDDQLTDNQA